MKKLILTAAIGMSSMAFAQTSSNENPFGTIYPSEQTTIAKHGNSNGKGSNLRPIEDVQAAAVNPWGNCKAAANQYRNGKITLDELKSYGCNPDGTEIVPVDGVVLPLLLSALALIVAFRRRIAEMVA